MGDGDRPAHTRKVPGSSMLTCVTTKPCVSNFRCVPHFITLDMVIRGSHSGAMNFKSNERTDFFFGGGLTPLNGSSTKGNSRFDAWKKNA